MKKINAQDVRTIGQVAKETHAAVRAAVQANPAMTQEQKRELRSATFSAKVLERRANRGQPA